MWLKTGCLGIVIPARHIDIPNIRQLGQQFDHCSALFMRLHSIVTGEFVHGEAKSDSTTVTNFFPGFFEYFADQTGTIFNASAILVATLIVLRQ